MKTKNDISAETKPKDAEVRETRIERAIRLLQTTAADSFQLKLREFKAFYPGVVAARHNKMKTKQILKIVADGGLKLYPALLENLIKAMERIEGMPICQQCGQTLHTDEADTNTGMFGSNSGEQPPEPPSGLP
ncbi:hypothetical protein [Xanthomonas arboricola]|uniref:hypothetical protein n=1 Tax=Xanthomonas arboricola TaxID=56448 RepID=UPI0012D31115|nr:hypothetical protein [Xanthomonas arboricola]